MSERTSSVVRVVVILVIAQALAIGSCALVAGMDELLACVRRFP